MILYLLNMLNGKGAVHEVSECIIAAMESKNVYSSGHSTRVADMVCDLTKQLGIKGSMMEDIHLAAHLHDIGKMSIPENILNKKDKLLPHEMAQIQMYPNIGYNILKKSKNMHKIAEIVRYHRERWDGKGYPDGLMKDKIPLGSRIIAVADAIDAMISDRPYRPAISWEDCKREVLENKGLQFDPVVVEAVEKVWGKWMNQKP